MTSFCSPIVIPARFWPGTINLEYSISKEKMDAGLVHAGMTNFNDAIVNPVWFKPA
jgi:hypothetical protein